jgi:hypothetical protein
MELLGNMGLMESCFSLFRIVCKIGASVAPNVP